ncbi:MAG TPA: TMEM175 family protein [Acidimicrobiales bacterium]|nr:TMEM175 family protein [Acidimicrobiales bacterium]
MKIQEPPEDAPGVGRLLALSDGVVAIALTLLVLSLHVPVSTVLHHIDPNSPGDLASALQGLTNPLISYVISFYVIAQFWLAHHRTFRLMAGHDEGLAWWNFLFLFAITLLPFSADLLGKYSENPLAVDIFALNLLLGSLSTITVITVAQRKGLLLPRATPEVLRSGRVRALGIVVVVAASMGVAWYSPDLAKYMWFLIAIVPRVMNRWVDRHLPIDDGTAARPGLNDGTAPGTGAVSPAD